MRCKRWRAGFRLWIPAVLGTALASPASAGLTYGVVWYTKPSDPARISMAAQRYDVGVTGFEDMDQAEILALDPGFTWYVYNSLTDNYTPPQPGAVEHEALLDIAAKRGWDAEEAYLHYAEDTRLILSGDTLLVPGWPHGRAKQASQARIPVYGPNRYLVHLATPRASQLYRQLIIQQAFGRPLPGSTHVADGVFLDNGAAKLFNYGTVLSGGAVAEAGGLGIQSPAFQDWHWNKNLGPFLTALKDTFETSASWSPDHRPKRIMLNVANIWDDSYVSRDVAHILFLEFQYSPIRSAGGNVVDEAYRRDRMAADAGITSFYSATTAVSIPGRRGAMSYDRVLLGNLAWYLVTRTETTIFFEMGTNAPHVAGWDTLTWRGCLETAAKQLGEAQGPPFTLAEGRDPAGQTYRVKARRYQHGLAVVRARGDWKEDLGPETAAVIPLRDPMALVHPNGKVGPVVSTLTLRNGEGAVLLGGP